MRHHNDNRGRFEFPVWEPVGNINVATVNQTAIAVSVFGNATAVNSSGIGQG